MIMLKRLKRVSLSLAKTAGLFSFVQHSRWRRARLLILGYHGIAIDDEHKWNPPLFMRQDHFRERLRIIRQSGCTVLTLDEGLRRLFSGDLPPNSVALTFDDGSYDFYKQAYPVLKEFDIPVTLYLTTFYSYYNRPVFRPTVSYVLWKGRTSTLNLKPLVGKDIRLNLLDPTERTKAFDELIYFAIKNRLSAEEKDELNVNLAKQLKIDYDTLLQKRILHIMTPDEVGRLAAEGVDVQLHTHRHRTPTDRELFTREIRDNRESIGSITGSFPTHFCYPAGVYADSFVPWLQEMGVESATTCDADLATRSSHPYFLPRLIDNSNLSPVEFHGWLSGLSAVLPQRRRS
jgi:peptidoglycan/xylan/chitin deacetylase (PgdA/CDA1 family)